MEENERKPIFANIFVPSKETYRQMYRRIRIGLTWLVAIAFGSAAIFAICKLLQLTATYGGSIFGSVYSWLMVAMAVYMIFAIVFIAFAPRRHRRFGALVARAAVPESLRGLRERARAVRIRPDPVDGKECRNPAASVRALRAG